MKNENTKHTPTPWHMFRVAMSAAQDCYRVMAENPHRILAIFPIQDWPDKETMNCQDFAYSAEQAKANAALLVAAPELLSALETAKKALICSLGYSQKMNAKAAEALAEIEAAIAKAKGE